MSWVIPILAAVAVQANPLAQGAVTKPIPRAQFLAEMDGQFRAMDADKNGQLTKAEIEQHQKLAASAAAAARNRAQFVELDADKSGFISPREFAKLTTPAPAAVNAQPMLAREDSNRDSQISLVEHRIATLANFDRLDTDKDGVVTAIEMKAAGIAR